MTKSAEALVNRCIRTEMYTLDEAMELVESYTINAIENWLDNLDEDILFDILTEYNGDLHQMDDVDTALDFLTVTEILTQMQDFDIDDDYFNSDTLESGNDLWDVSHCDIGEIARNLYNDYTQFGEHAVRLKAIFEQESEMKAIVNRKFNLYSEAKKLFDMVMENCNPQEVIAALWSLSE